MLRTAFLETVCLFEAMTPRVLLKSLLKLGTAVFLLYAAGKPTLGYAASDPTHPPHTSFSQYARCVLNPKTLEHRQFVNHAGSTIVMAMPVPGLNGERRFASPARLPWESAPTIRMSRAMCQIDENEVLKRRA